MDITNSLYCLDFASEFELPPDAEKESEFLFHEFSQIFNYPFSIYIETNSEENFGRKYNDVIGMLDSKLILKEEEMKKESSSYGFSSKKLKLN